MKSSFIYFQNTNRRLSNNNALLTIAYAVYGLLCSAVFVVVLALKVEDSLYVVAYPDFSHIHIHTSETKKKRCARIDSHVNSIGFILRRVYYSTN